MENKTKRKILSWLQQQVFLYFFKKCLRISIIYIKFKELLFCHHRVIIVTIILKIIIIIIMTLRFKICITLVILTYLFKLYHKKSVKKCGCSIFQNQIYKVLSTKLNERIHVFLCRSLKYLTKRHIFKSVHLIKRKCTDETSFINKFFHSFELAFIFLINQFFFVINF